MSSMPALDEVLDLVSQVSAITGPIAGEEAREVPRHYLEVFALYDRCRSMLAAMRVLIERGFVHEAMILSRPLLTDSLAFAELAASDEKSRVERVVGWELHSLASLRGALTEAEANSVGDFGAMIAWIDKRKAEIEAYAREHGVGTRHWEPDRSSKELAINHDRVTEYLDVRIAHHFVHGSTLATSQRYSSDADDKIMVGGPAVNRELWAVTAGCSGAQSVLLASRSFCAILEIDEPPDLEARLGELQSLADRIKSASDRAGSSDSAA